METTIGELKHEHWDQVCGIYLEGIATGLATFETMAPSWEEWDSNHLPFGRLVAVTGQDSTKIAGWAALSRVSSRSAYAGVAEVSVYVAKQARGKGVGRALLGALVHESERRRIWTLQASIFPENVASVGLHKTGGFREVGIRERVGQLNRVWRDTVLMERRSKLAGAE